jgi:hypothetical protein
VKLVHSSRLIVCAVILLFFLGYLSQVETVTLAVQAEPEWEASPMHVSQLADLLAFSGYSPSQLKMAYNLPSTGGNGTTIAVIIAFDTPDILSYLVAFSSQFGLPAPNESNFEIHKMGSNIMANTSWSLEACLDVEWAHAIAPDAKILLVEAKTNSIGNLLSAIDYAANRPDVVAVTMSWGGDEFANENAYDWHFNKPSVTFFASSGDYGSGVLWPACSANVVAVGGTKLNLNVTDGTVVSETAWSESGGGISAYVTLPTYQVDYGLNSSRRAVPDVAYNADPSTGVKVYYNSQWYVVGGTSAGSPQWAAIHALGLSAKHVNLYDDAKLDYSSYFRDIISGSNGEYNATSGYDCVTGLGSPMTFNFRGLAVSPSSGAAGGSITLSGVGFTANSSASISYLDPKNSTWVTIIDDLPITSAQNISYTFSAPDLHGNIPAGDNQPIYDNIIFHAVDNSNGNVYTTTIPYAEWRRGLVRAGSVNATGLYGNNTDFGTTLFVQSGQSIAIVGKWFSPGSASLLWDDVSILDNVTIDETGILNVTTTVPTTFAGQHTLAISDGPNGSTNFCVSLTRLPTITNDYDNSWHTTDFTIDLTADFNVTQTYYRINNGTVSNIAADGQPLITTEGSNNTLEYWSTWSIYELNDIELPHIILTGIQLDKTPPQGSLTINNGATSTSSRAVTLNVSATDSLSGISQIRFSNDNIWDQSIWEQIANSKSWQLTDGDGVKTVYCQIRDVAGSVTNLSSSIILETTNIVQDSSPSATANPSLNANSTFAISPSPTPTLSPIQSEHPSAEPLATPAVPELSIQMILILFALLAILSAFKYKRNTQKSHATCQNK